MSDDEYEEATPEQKQAIASYFLSSSPTGEVHEVLVDVAKIIDDKTVLSDEKIKEIMKKYNEEQMQPVMVGNRSVVVSAYGKVGQDDGEYLDPSTGKVFKFDHRKHEFVADTEMKQELAEGIAAHRAAIEKQMDEYQELQYKKDKCTVTVYGADDGNITICVSARNMRLSSFWAGGWRSVFTLNVGTKGTTKMKSSTKTNVHYFEDGNVQLHCAVEKTANINVQDPASTAEEVRKAVANIETSFQKALYDIYVDLHEKTFKLFRRFLPLTKQPMQWNQYAHHIKSDLAGK